jgi:hypothetical protein
MAAGSSLLEEARRTFPGCSDLECIQRVAARVIEDLDERPPISLEVVASYRDIVSVRLEPLPFAGSLTPETSGLVMRLNSRDPRGRRRFSGFHEVGHTFQPGYLQQTLFRCNPQPSNPSSSANPEQLADVAAAELLLPRRHFESDLSRAERGWDGVIGLAENYEASLQATALRAVQLSDSPMLLVTLEPGFRKSERASLGAEPKLRVTSSVSNGNFPYIPRNKSAAEGGALLRALEGEIVEDTTSLLEFDIPTDRLRVSARLFPYADDRGEFHQRVMALFWYAGKRSAA